MEQIEQLQNAVEQANAEKLALDQMLVDNIQKFLTAKKDLIILNQQLAKLQQENVDLKAQLELPKPDLVDTLEDNITL
jgi:hypothetical protein